MEEIIFLKEFFQLWNLRVSFRREKKKEMRINRQRIQKKKSESDNTPATAHSQSSLLGS